MMYRINQRSTLVMTGFDHFQSMVSQRRLAPAHVYLLSDVDDETARAQVPGAQESSVVVYGTKGVDAPPYAEGSTRSAFDLVSHVLSSSYPLLMLDRQPTLPPKDMLRQQQAVMRSTLRCIEMLERHEIKRLISCSTPHQAATFIMFTVARLMGLECFILERSPIPHRYWTTQGLEHFPEVSLEAGAHISDRTRRMIAQVTGVGESPTDDLARQKARYGSASYSIRRELGEVVRSAAALRPWGVLRVLLKYRLWNRYEQMCRARPPTRRKRVTFFLHYQPERTTLPEAGLFVVQELALTMLAAMLPEEFEIVVREHPSTWLLPLQYGGRSSEDYGGLSAITRLRFALSTQSVNDLIDSSAVVATCTGKVGLQALLRGKPVLAFGFPAYSGHPYCRRITTQQDLQAALDWLATLGPDSREQITGASLAYVRGVEEISREEQPIAEAGSRRAQRLNALTAELELLFNLA